MTTEILIHTGSNGLQVHLDIPWCLHNQFNYLFATFSIPCLICICLDIPSSLCFHMRFFLTNKKNKATWVITVYLWTPACRLCCNCPSCLFFFYYKMYLKGRIQSFCGAGFVPRIYLRLYLPLVALLTDHHFLSLFDSLLSLCRHSLCSLSMLFVPLLQTHTLRQGCLCGDISG